MSREELIHQLSQEMGIPKKEEGEKSGYVSATGTMYGDGKEYPTLKEEMEKAAAEDPWNKLELHPVCFK